jgi:hypothetical protein
VVSVTESPVAVPVIVILMPPPWPQPENAPEALSIVAIVQVCVAAPPLPQQLQVPVRSCVVAAEAGLAPTSSPQMKTAAVSARNRIKPLLSWSGS